MHLGHIQHTVSSTASSSACWELPWPRRVVELDRLRWRRVGTGPGCSLPVYLANSNPCSYGCVMVGLGVFWCCRPGSEDQFLLGTRPLERWAQLDLGRTCWELVWKQLIDRIM